jgi:hypothetical protein
MTFSAAACAASWSLSAFFSLGIHQSSQYTLAGNPSFPIVRMDHFFQPEPFLWNLLPVALSLTARRTFQRFTKPGLRPSLYLWRTRDGSTPWRYRSIMSRSGTCCLSYVPPKYQSNSFLKIALSASEIPEGRYDIANSRCSLADVLTMRPVHDVRADAETECDATDYADNHQPCGNSSPEDDRDSQDDCEDAK